MDEYLWPARHVAEFAYCPRLFYLMEVEGVFVPSTDTELGNAVHRRVDRPSHAARERDEGAAGGEPPAIGSPNENSAGRRALPVLPTAGDSTELAEVCLPPTSSDDDDRRPKSVRSLTLTSKALGLTATLDLAEIAGQVAVPIEYRKGRPRRGKCAVPSDDGGQGADGQATAEPWPTDRIQVGLQAILLEEAGYVVKEAVLYYAAEKLRLRLSVDATLRGDALRILRQAQSAAAKSRPLPLVNDPKCVRCSLQPFCLPDEVNQQREAAGADAGAGGPRARSIWPVRDDALHVVAQQEGTKIGISGMSLRVTDKTGQETRKLPLANLESLAVLGGVQVSTQAMHALADRGIPLAFLTSAGRLVTMMDACDSASAELRRAQIRTFDQPAKCLELTRALVTAKIINQRILLQRNHAGLADAVLEDMQAEADSARRGAGVDAVRGHEGQAAAIYFAHFAGLFKTDLAAEFDANGRQRRPPPDPINAVLSFAYTMLTNECVSALRLARLEPTVGAFHTSRPGRPALALDLMEPFRPLIADSVSISCFNRGELAAGHFVRTAAGCALTEHGRRAFFGAWGRRMDTEVTHGVFGYKLSYRRMLMLHARMISAWMMGEVPTLAFLTTR